MKYDAFISYRHLEKDMYAAKKIHKMLESVRLPRNIKKETGKKRINRVFRDQDELPIGSDLGSKINQALMDSEYLIVICSPYTQNSRWVMQEINTFIAMHGRKNILAVLVEGEPEESFPPQLLIDDYGYPVEPLAADVRGENHGEMKRKIATETVRLAAAILGVDYDELRQRRREGKVKRNFAIAAACAVLGISFGAYNAYNVARINENYQQKLINESKVLSEKSLEVLEAGDRKTAALLAMEALPSEDNDRVFAPEAMYALSKALNEYDVGDDFYCQNKISCPINIKKWCIEGNSGYLVVADEEDNVSLYNARTGELLFEKPAEYIDEQKVSVQNVAMNAEGVVIVVTNEYIQGYDVTGKSLYRVDNDVCVTGADFTNDHEYAVVLTLESQKEHGNFGNIYDVNTGERLYRFEYPNAPGLDITMIKLNKERDYLAVSHGSENLGDGIFTITNLKTSECFDIDTGRDRIKAMSYSLDDALVVLSVYDSADILGTYGPVVLLQKYDYKSRTLIWEKEIEFSQSVMGSSYKIGTTDGRYLIMADNEIHTFNSETGDVISAYKLDSSIRGAFISGDSAFVPTNDGLINYFNYITGDKYSQFQCPAEIYEAKLGADFIAVKDLKATDVYIISVKIDETIESVYDFDHFTHSMSMSPDESTLVYEYIDYSTEEDDSVFTILDVETATEIDTIKIQPGHYKSVQYEYVDNDTVYFLDNDKSIYYYTISEKKLEKIDFDYKSAYLIAKDNHAIQLADPDGYYIYDLKERKVTKTGPILKYKVDESAEKFSRIIAGDLTNDDKYILYVTDTKHLYRVNTETGDIDHILKEYVPRDVITSGDNATAAILCDGSVTVFDIATAKIIDSITFNAHEKYLISFIPDTNYLVCQGDDRHLKIYNVKEKKIEYISSEVYEEIDGVSYDEENSKMVFITNDEMIIFDIDTMGNQQSVPFGVFYMPDDNMILAANQHHFYKMKIKNLAELKEDFTKQFGDAQLTEEQRLMFKID